MSEDTQRSETARLAYEEDVRRKPFYHDKTDRPTWDQLKDYAKESWRRNPKPREWGKKS